MTDLTPSRQIAIAVGASRATRYRDCSASLKVGEGMATQRKEL